MSHSNELERIRQLLTARRKVLSDRHQRVKRDLARENDPLLADSADRAIQLENDEALEAIDEAVVSEMTAIDVALRRLDSGQYGICEVCDGLIESSRLVAVPHAMTCAGCASG